MLYLVNGDLHDFDQSREIKISLRESSLTKRKSYRSDALIEIDHGLRQGCNMSPDLFVLYAEKLCEWSNI